jgi:membrane protease YdiL (CAAX protease family)
MPSRLAIFTAIYLFLWLVTWPALLADLQADRRDKESADRNYRRDLGVTMLWALFPPMWIATPFQTGFYQHGFQFGRRG